MLGFDSTIQQKVRKHISYPSQFHGETGSSMDDEEFLLQVAAHENLLKSILVQFDINPKLDSFEDWR